MESPCYEGISRSVGPASWRSATLPQTQTTPGDTARYGQTSTVEQVENETGTLQQVEDETSIVEQVKDEAGNLTVENRLVLHIKWRMRTVV
jgi:hypothetical protein